MSWTVSSDSIPHGQKQAFIYMLVNGMEIGSYAPSGRELCSLWSGAMLPLVEDYEHDDYFASYRSGEDTTHLFKGLHP